MAETHRESFDAVCGLEVMGHVEDVGLFLRSCAACIRPGGRLFLSILNRTPEAFAVAIVGAEHMLGLLPVGSHEFNKFVSLVEIASTVHGCGLVVRDVSGMVYTWCTHHGRRLRGRAARTNLRIVGGRILEEKIPDLCF